MTVWPSAAPARGGRGRANGRARARLCGIASALLLAAAATALGSATPASAEVPAGTPLPPSNYTAQPVCGQATPGHASCLAVRLVPKTAAARAQTHPIGIKRRHAIRAGAPAEGADGLRPQDLRAAYNLPAEAPIPQTVAIVDAYNDPSAEADLGVYDSEFHLPACTKENGCFKKVNWEGKESSYPANEGGWALEVSLDIETTHAVCPNCKILLVEAKNETDPNLQTAVNEAAALGATEISNSYGGPPEGGDPGAYNHPGIAVVAATGDYGYLNWETFTSGWVGHPDYPAVSPHVVAAGGTRLKVEESEWKAETVWNDGGSEVEGEPTGHGATGGGCSEELTAQPWQQAVADWAEVGCGTKRAAADVAADGDPYSGVAVYDSTLYPPAGRVLHWTPIGGTSLASPIIASVFALAGGSGGVSYPAQTLYQHLGTSALHDIVSGSNGECKLPFNELEGVSSCTTKEEAAQCSEKLVCLAATGYDGPSGVGTPDGVGAFKPPAPTLTAVEPTSGTTGGGRSATLKGTHLLGAIKVEFGSAQASEVHVVSAGELTLKTPAHAAGTVNVTVTTPGGTSTVVPADEYTYVTPPPPTVTAVEATEGSTIGGRTVKIVGTNLEDASEVHFGAASASEVHEISATEITVKTPAHEAETVDVTVTTPGGTSATAAADHYTYVTPPPPTVTAISPSEGSIAGGATVTVTGTNLEGASVKFGSSAGGEVHVVSATELTVKTPTHAAATVDVTVTTPGGTSAASAADHYTYALPPPEPPPGGSTPPPSNSGTSLTSSPFLSTYSGLTSTASNTFSNFNLLGEQVNGKSGAVKVTVAVFHRGTLHWTLTYREAGKHARTSTVIFGQGTKAVSGAMIVSFTVSPAAAAKRALQRALRHRGSLAVVANLTYTAAGGSPIAHTASLSVRLSKRSKNQRRG